MQQFEEAPLWRRRRRRRRLLRSWLGRLLRHLLGHWGSVFRPCRGGRVDGLWLAQRCAGKKIVQVDALRWYLCLRHRRRPLLFFLCLWRLLSPCLFLCLGLFLCGRCVAEQRIENGRACLVLVGEHRRRRRGRGCICLRAEQVVEADRLGCDRGGRRRRRIRPLLQAACECVPRTLESVCPAAPAAKAQRSKSRRYPRRLNHLR